MRAEFSQQLDVLKWCISNGFPLSIRCMTVTQFSDNGDPNVDTCKRWLQSHQGRRASMNAGFSKGSSLQAAFNRVGWTQKRTALVESLMQLGVKREVFANAGNWVRVCAPDQYIQDMLDFIDNEGAVVDCILEGNSDLLKSIAAERNFETDSGAIIMISSMDDPNCADVVSCNRVYHISAHFAALSGCTRFLGKGSWPYHMPAGRHLTMYACFCEKTALFVAESGALFSTHDAATLSLKGNLKLLQQLLARGSPMDKLVSNEAARMGNLDILEWTRTANVPWSEETFLSGLEGRPSVMEYLKSNKCP